MAEETPVSIDEIIGRIHEEVARRRAANGSVAPSDGPALTRFTPPPAELGAAERALSKAQQTWRVGEELPPMHNQSGPAKILAKLAGGIFLRMSQLFTRDQRQFNEATVAALQALIGAIRTQSARWDSIVAPQLVRTLPVVDLGDDALTRLRGRADASCAAVIGRTDRLPPDALGPLLTESRRVLAPGGVAILETGDAEALRALAGKSGFGPVEIVQLAKPAIVAHRS